MRASRACHFPYRSAPLKWIKVCYDDTFIRIYCTHIRQIFPSTLHLKLFHGLIWFGTVFLRNIMRQGASAKDYEMAIYWLLDCGLLSECCRVYKPSIPLKAYENFSVFKLFLVDIGLLSSLSHLDSKILVDGDSVFTEFKGALTEQFVMQELMVAHHDSTYRFSLLKYKEQGWMTNVPLYAVWII